ncbi:TPA: hypothetical protein NJ328_001264 [Vibrio parahaemolyticus]|nr:hypothetical protein [Vibrio parahaemolyticus]
MKDDGLTINTNYLRECRFYWRWMSDGGAQLPPEPQTCQQYCTAINAVLDAKYWNADEARREYVKEMENALLAKLVPQKELEWISSKEERLCYWIWLSCRIAIRSNVLDSNKLVLSFNQQDDSNRPYIEYGLNQLPFTAQERYDLIINFLDFSPADIEAKRWLLNEWRQGWEQNYSTERFVKPNPDDEEYCSWLWSYLKSNEEYFIPHWFIPTPKTSKERFNASVAAFDIWQTDESTKKLFITRMKKAWSQKKHRLAMKKKNKKSYNFTLCTSTKEMLDKMADKEEISRNEFLERLIKTAHSQQ